MIHINNIFVRHLCSHFRFLFPILRFKFFPNFEPVQFIQRYLCKRVVKVARAYVGKEAPSSASSATNFEFFQCSAGRQPILCDVSRVT